MSQVYKQREPLTEAEFDTVRSLMVAEWERVIAEFPEYELFSGENRWNRVFGSSQLSLDYDATGSSYQKAQALLPALHDLVVHKELRLDRTYHPAVTSAARYSTPVQAAPDAVMSKATRAKRRTFRLGADQVQALWTRAVVNHRASGGGHRNDHQYVVYRIMMLPEFVRVTLYSLLVGRTYTAVGDNAVAGTAEFWMGVDDYTRTMELLGVSSTDWDMWTGTRRDLMKSPRLARTVHDALVAAQDRESETLERRAEALSRALVAAATSLSPAEYRNMCIAAGLSEEDIPERRSSVS